MLPLAGSNLDVRLSGHHQHKARQHQLFRREGRNELEPPIS
jgi:hypothetical protein